MLLADNLPEASIVGIGDPTERRFREERRSLIFPPLDMLIQREGNAIRLAAIDRGRYISSGPVSAATKYAFYWAEDADTSTRDKLDAAFRLATLVDQVPRTYVEREAIYGTLLTDPKYSSGFFFCVGMNDEGDKSTYIISSRQQNVILNSAIPGPVTDLQVSESGEPANETTLSVLAFTYVSPTINGDSFVGIQPMIRDYPAIGDLTQYTPLLYSGPPNQGAGGGLLRIPPARRTGNGTISIAGTAVTGVGSTFTQIAKADDQLEVFGVRRRILSVNNDTSITLTAAWPATPAVAAVAQYVIVGKCRVYALSLSESLEHSYDETQWPYVDVDIDGDLSAPNAPASLILTPFGNGIRGQFVQVAGTGIKQYVVYRSTGTTNDITTAEEIIPPIKHDPTTPNGGTVLQFEDTKFTVYEREQGQDFRYYIRTVNVRDEPSSGYATATASCRLDSGADGSDPPFKIGLKNVVYNGFFSGTNGNTILANDTSQDATFDVSLGTPGRPYGSASGQANGAGKFKGYTRWESNDAGSGAAGNVTFQDGEAWFAAPGAGKVHYLYQEIEAWDTAKGADFVKLEKDSVCCYGISIARDPGSPQPNGTFTIYLELYNNNVLVGEALLRSRNATTDILEWTSGHKDISGSDLLSTWTLHFGVFNLDSTVGTVKQLRVNLAWFHGTQGIIRVSRVMVNHGEEVGAPTPDMGDTTVSYPVPGFPPGQLGDGEGKRTGEVYPVAV